jgi:hypothetical protein
MNKDEFGNLRIAGNEIVKIIYVVSIITGEHDKVYQTTLFATYDKEYAEKYVNKFNRVLNKWHQHYKDLQKTDMWLTDDLYFKNEERWDLLDEVKCATYEYCKFYDK